MKFPPNDNCLCSRFVHNGFVAMVPLQSVTRFSHGTTKSPVPPYGAFSHGKGFRILQKFLPLLTRTKSEQEFVPPHQLTFTPTSRSRKPLRRLVHLIAFVLPN